MLVLPVFVAWGPSSSCRFSLRAPTSGILAPVVTRAGADESNGIPNDGGESRLSGSHTRITWAGRRCDGVRRGRRAVSRAPADRIATRCAIRRGAVQSHGRLTHPACVTPMTVGIIAPVVILPPDWASWNDAELAAVLAHEEEHVRRRDPLVAGVALLNRAIFWFHPLAWWLQRKIACLSEQACDAVVISRGHDRDVYSACLLRFARRAADAGGRIAPTATAMPGVGLRERLGMLADQLPAPPSRARLACAAVSGVALCRRLCGGDAGRRAGAKRAVAGPESGGMAGRDVGALRDRSR